MTCGKGFPSSSAPPQDYPVPRSRLTIPAAKELRNLPIRQLKFTANKLRPRIANAVLGLYHLIYRRVYKARFLIDKVLLCAIFFP